MKGFEKGFGGKEAAGEPEPSVRQELDAIMGMFRSNIDRERMGGLGIEAWRDKLIASGEVSPGELLDLMGDLALEINAVFLDGYFSKDEAEALLEELRDSKGRDNHLTMAIMFFVAQRKTTMSLDERDGTK